MLKLYDSICQILFRHVVGFALPKLDQDFKQVSASYVSSIWESSAAMLGPTLAIFQKQPKNAPPKRSPPAALKARQNQIKTAPKRQKSANTHGSETQRR